MDHFRHCFFFAHISKRDPAVLAIFSEPVKISDFLLLFAIRARSVFRFWKKLKTTLHSHDSAFLLFFFHSFLKSINHHRKKEGALAPFFSIEFNTDPYVTCFVSAAILTWNKLCIKIRKSLQLILIDKLEVKLRVKKSKEDKFDAKLRFAFIY